jgi:hypothetical protein
MNPHATSNHAMERTAGRYFATVRVTLGDARDIEFGIPHDEYLALRHILQSRPFDQLPACSIATSLLMPLVARVSIQPRSTFASSKAAPVASFHLRFRFHLLATFIEG